MIHCGGSAEASVQSAVGLTTIPVIKTFFRLDAPCVAERVGFQTSKTRLGYVGLIGGEIDIFSREETVSGMRCATVAHVVDKV